MFYLFMSVRSAGEKTNLPMPTKYATNSYLQDKGYHKCKIRVFENILKSIPLLIKKYQQISMMVTMKFGSEITLRVTKNIFLAATPATLLK